MTFSIKSGKRTRTGLDNQQINSIATSTCMQSKNLIGLNHNPLTIKAAPVPNRKSSLMRKNSMIVQKERLHMAILTNCTTKKSMSTNAYATQWKISGTKHLSG